MNILKKLIRFHRFLFLTAILFTFLSVILSLRWNSFLAKMIDMLEEAALCNFQDRIPAVFTILPTGIAVILLLTICEYLSSYLASYTCELFAHDMRMGYARYYLQRDFRTLSRLNAGEEQSAMQNELKEVSDYLNENLFSLVKQFGTFAVTVVFLLCQNPKLTVFSVLPVVPLILYCSFSSKIIRQYTGQCQSSRQKIKGLADMILTLFPIIQIYDAYKMIQGTMTQQLSEWEHANVAKERISAKLMSLSGVLSFVPLLLLLGFGGFMVINEEISMGTFYIFINLSGNVSGFLQNMPGIYAGFRRFGASADRLGEKIVLTENKRRKA